MQLYAAKAFGDTLENDFAWLEEYGQNEVKRAIRSELGWYISSFISDVHREFIVRCHARGLSTSAAVTGLMKVDETMNRLSHRNAMEQPELREILAPRLTYLKPGSARWPEKKYGSVWRKERQEYRQVVSDIPFTSQVEQVALLAKLAERINYELDNKVHTVKDLQSLTHSLVNTVDSLQKLSMVNGQHIPGSCLCLS